MRHIQGVILSSGDRDFYSHYSAVFLVVYSADGFTSYSLAGGKQNCICFKHSMLISFFGRAVIVAAHEFLTESMSVVGRCSLLSIPLLMVPIYWLQYHENRWITDNAVINSSFSAIWLAKLAWSQPFRCWPTSKIKISKSNLLCRSLLQMDWSVYWFDGVIFPRAILLLMNCLLSVYR